MAFKCYQKSQDSNKLDYFTQLMIDKSIHQPGLHPLVEYFISQTNHQLASRKKMAFITQFDSSESIDVLITGDPITSSRLCQTIRSLGYRSQLIIDGLILELEKIEQLSISLILVGNIVGDNSLMERHIPSEKRKEFNHQVTYHPYEGQVQFQIGNCQAYWIKGGWNRKTADLVDNLIQSPALIGFLKRQPILAE